ncbi:hypothetical protein KA005_26165 [bacterium]|nr:hypothetical protein [bacterium]
MAIGFNNIPTNTRTPGVYNEIDNSRALKGLTSNPSKVLIIGQKPSTGSADVESIKQITSDGLADGYFGNGSILGRMCNTFKKNNPNTELHAIALSNNGGVKAENVMKLASGASATDNTALYLLANGTKFDIAITSAWSVTDINSAIVANINLDSTLPIIASTSASAAGSDHVVFIAVQSGTLGNYIDVRLHYFVGQSNPKGWESTEDVTIGAMAGGLIDPDLGDAWAVIDNEQYHYIVQPYVDAANLTEIEDE